MYYVFQFLECVVILPVYISVNKEGEICKIFIRGTPVGENREGVRKDYESKYEANLTLSEVERGQREVGRIVLH